KLLFRFFLAIGRGPQFYFFANNYYHTFCSNIYITAGCENKIENQPYWCLYDGVAFPNRKIFDWILFCPIGSRFSLWGSGKCCFASSLGLLHLSYFVFWRGI